MIVDRRDVSLRQARAGVGRRSAKDGREKGRGLLARPRVQAVALVAVAAPSYPDLALREGAVLCGLVLLTALAHVKLRAADLMAIGLAVVAWASTTWALDAAASDLGAKNLTACVVIYLCVRTVANRRSDVRTLALGVVGGCLLGLARLFVDNPGTRVRLEYDSQAARVGIQGLNYNALAYGFAVGAAMVVLLLATSRSRSRSWSAVVVGGVTFALLYAGVILSGTRGALLAIGLLLGWLFFGRRSPRRLFKGLAIVAVLSHAAVFLGFADRLLYTVVGRTVRETGDLNGRLAIWPVARDAVWGKPFNGYGVDGVAALPQNLFGIAAHNVTLDIAVGLGLPGLLLLVGVAVASFREALWAAAPRDYLATGAYLTVITPITLTGFWVESPLLWLTLGVLSRLGAPSWVEFRRSAVEAPPTDGRAKRHPGS